MLISFISCETSLDEPVLTNIQKIEQEDIEKYTIPISNAIEELERSIPSFSNINSKPKVIKEVITIYKQNENGIFTDKPILYAINFENDNGYAVMAADYRIKGSLLSYVEEGNTSIQDFYPNNELTEEMREYYKDFPFYNEELNEYCVAINNNFPNTTTLEYATSWTQDPSEIQELIVTKVKKWQIKDSVNALIQTKWHQDDCFKSYTPIVQKGIIVGNKKHAPAGCVPVAIAQIITYHKNAKITIKDQEINLKEIEKNVCNKINKIYHGDDNQKLMTGYLLRIIGDLCQSRYTYFFTFTYPTYTIKCFDTFGFIHTRTRKHYSGKGIISMLQAKNPILLCGVSRHITNGHGWVIDGYKKRMRERYIENHNISTHPTTPVAPEEQFLVHCNWGWRGKCDGYYESGIFKLYEGAIIPDVEIQKSNKHYNKKFFTLTYDEVKPIDTGNLNF